MTILAAAAAAGGLAAAAVLVLGAAASLTAVVLAVSAPHRKAALEAVETFIARMKREVPVWKKEFFEDGDVWVGLGP